jgi:hypothetical protein
MAHPDSLQSPPFHQLKRGSSTSVKTRPRVICLMTIPPWYRLLRHFTIYREARQQQGDLSFRIEMGGKVRKRHEGRLFTAAKGENDKIRLKEDKNMQIFM